MFRLLFLLLAGLKFGKLFITGGTMLLSVLLYAYVFGWPYAVGLVAMLFVHEMGHYIAARYKGLDAGLPMFIPFFGSWVQMKKMPHDAQTEAFVGLGGPLLGTVGALVCYFLARNYDAPWLLAVAYSGFLINLINMIPISPLDGGRITAVLSPRIWLLGVPMLIGLFFYWPSPMLIIIAIMAAPQVMTAIRYRSDSLEGQTYYAVPSAVKWEYGCYYLVLAGFLAVMVHDVNEMLGPHRV